MPRGGDLGGPSLATALVEHAPCNVVVVATPAREREAVAT